MKQILLDSNILIQLVNGEIPANKIFFEDCDYSVSIITFMEVMGYSFKNENDENTFKELFNKFTIRQIDFSVAIQVIKIRKIKKIKLPDAIIAATSIIYDLVLMTRNESDFTSIEGIKIINP